MTEQVEIKLTSDFSLVQGGPLFQLFIHLCLQAAQIGKKALSAVVTSSLWRT